MFKAQKIYHGCFTKNKDGTNRLIEKSKICICPIDKPFWKYPEDVSSGVKTRAQKNQKKISATLFDNYFKQKDIQRWLEADDSELVFFKRIGQYICSTMIFFWVNNRNILTDGGRYRKRPRIEM